MVPLLLTLGLIAARIFPAAAISDPTAGQVDPALHLSAPWVYVAFAPLFTMWDGISMLSMSRLRGLLVGLAALYLVVRVARAIRPGTSPRREAAVLLAELALFTAFLIVGALWHRPMLALAGVGPEYAVVDFHSHTNVSHDVRGTLMEGFDADANRRWHRRAGFDAVFVTDHNTVAGLPDTSTPGLPRICPGIEVSAWRAHILLLGDTFPVPREPYSRTLKGLLELLRTSDSAFGARSLGSLPEYERNHWNRLDTLLGAGLDGLEVVNAAPKANELSRVRRDSVVALARRYNRFIVGVSDHHGWGATSMVWNLVRLPAWRDRPDTLCAAVLARLGAGFPAVRILERHRLRPDDWWASWLTPIGVVWETWRSMGWPCTLSWIAWIWAASLVGRRIGSART